MKKFYHLFLFLLLFYCKSYEAISQTGCDLNLIRQTFTNAGCTELQNCLSSCSMYFYNPLSQTGDAAQAWAQNYGAGLVSLQSGTENSCIVTDLNNNGFSGIIWIGFNDIASEGSFVWYDQSPIVYTNWHSGEPNNSGNEDCVQIYPDGQWNDLNCASGGSKSVIEVNLCPQTTINPTATSICAGQSVTLTASTILGSSPYTYGWVSNLGGFTSSSYGPTVTPLTTTTYSVTSTDRYGCTSNASVTINVNTSLNASIGGGGTVCLNEPPALVQFTGTNGTAPYTFTYMIDGGAQQTVTTTSGSSVSVSAPSNAAGNSVYTLLRVTDSNGCSQARSGDDTVTVTPLPTATISGDTSICQNATGVNITFKASSATPVPYTFTYTINGGPNQTITTPLNDTMVSIPVSTTTGGTFVYSLVSVESWNHPLCAQTQNGTATVVVNALPTALVSGTTDVCRNSVSPNVTFTGAAGTAPYTFTYTINNGSTQTITTTSGNSVNAQALTMSAGTFTYTLVSVQDANCPQTQTDTAAIKVEPLPTATITGTTAVCKNNASPNITFTGANGTAPYTFTYTINGVAQPTVTTTSGNSTTVSVPTSVAGSFVYGLVGIKDSSPPACLNPQTSTATITINPLPTANAIGTTAVCKNAISPAIKFIGASGTPPYTFTYTINNGASQTVVSTSGDTAIVNAPTANTGVYTYKLLSVEDASASTCNQAQTDSAIVTVNGLPTAIITGSTTVCKNETGPQLAFTGTGTTLPYTFSYTINNGSPQALVCAAGDSIATIAAPTTVDGTFLYSLISVQDASSTTCVQLQTDTAQVIVNPLPTAQITGTTSICDGNAAPTITFTGASSTTPYTFTYNLNNGSNQTVSSTNGNSASITAPNTPNGLYTYTLISVQDGSNNACFQTQNGTALITINPNPIVTFTSSDSLGCSPLCINFIDQSNIATGANILQTWKFGDGIINTNAAHCYINDPSNGGSYSNPINYTVTLIVTSDSGCVDSLTKTNFISTNPNPDASFTLNPQKANIVNPIIALTNTSLGATSWQWSFGDSTTISTDQNPLPHTYADTGSYQVMLITTNQFQCVDTAFETVVIEPDFMFYIPSAFSPNGDGLNDYFICKGLFFTDFELRIFDRWGNLIFTSTDVNIGWDGKSNKTGNLVQQETYVYAIHLTDLTKKVHTYRGIVTVLK